MNLRFSLASCAGTGLMGAMSGLPPQALLEGNVLFTDYKGAITENMCYNN